MSVFLSRIASTLTRGAIAKCSSMMNIPELTLANRSFLTSNRGIYASLSQFTCRYASTDTVEPVVPIENASIALKKKTVHKKADVEELKLKEGHYLTLAYATANSYDLKGLKAALAQQKLYEPGKLKALEVGDVVIANAMYPVGDEPREILFFQEGAVVFWNCSELEANNVLDFVKKYEIESYPTDVIHKEREVMSYVYQPNSKKCHLQESTFVLLPDRDNSLERYTFSHAMAQSARLGAWESRLGGLAASVAAHTHTMRASGTPLLDRKQIVRSLGEVFSLRHRLTVESDLLDTPDFYWEEARLERLYSATVHYFTIPRRTRVLNERLSHCVELLELLSSWAADRHHVRLELMIIVLILAEVAIELRHWLRPIHHSTSGQLQTTS